MSLRRTGIFPTAVDEEQARAATQASAQTGVESGGLFARVSTQELALFTRQFATLAKAGLTLIECLGTLIEQMENARLKRILTHVRQQVREGRSLADALQAHPRLFTSLYVNMIRAGEESGSLPESLLELKRFLEWQETIIADVRQATIYPAVVLLMVIAFVLVLFTFVVPRFVTLLTSVKVPLPMATKIVFGACDFAVATWWIWLIAMVVGPLAVVFGCRWSHRFALWVDHIKFKLPLFGPINHMLAMSRFARSLSVLYRAGVSILQGLKLCEDLAGSPIVARDLRDVQHRIEEGSTLSEALRRHPIFPSLLIRMTVMGEKSGNLDGALDNVSEYYNVLIPRRIKKLFGVMEPILILTLVGIVGFVALAIFMPILSLMQSMR